MDNPLGLTNQDQPGHHHFNHDKPTVLVGGSCLIVAERLHPQLLKRSHLGS